MKSWNWALAKKLVYLASLTLVVLATTACPSDKGGKSNVSKRTRSDDYNRPMSNNSRISNRTENSEWGTISHTGMNVLREFMNGAGDLGFVSPREDDATGIRFRGSVPGGRVEFLVWDEVASNTNQAFFWGMKVVDVRNSGSSTVVTVEDSLGQVVLEGNISGGRWSGQIYFQNFDGGVESRLGTFNIPAASIL
jgi:hypothetical protein